MLHHADVVTEGVQTPKDASGAVFDALSTAASEPPSPHRSSVDDDGLDCESTRGPRKRGIQFSTSPSAHNNDDDDDDDDDGKHALAVVEKPHSRRGSKVYPVDEGLEARSATSSIQSKSSVALFHKAVEHSDKYEEHSLVLLRRLLIIVSLFVCAMSVATMQISKRVITEGMDGAIVTAQAGARQINQLVSDCGVAVAIVLFVVGMRRVGSWVCMPH